MSNAYQHGAVAVVFCTTQFQIDRRVAQFQRRWQVAIDDLVQANAEFIAIDNPSQEQLEAQRQKIEGLVEQVKKHGERIRDAYDPVLGFTEAGEADSRRDMPVAHCRRGQIDRVLKAAVGKDLATLEREIDNGPTPQSFELPGWRLQGEIAVERDEVEVKNVVAVLEGEGPRADETIVIGAHYDHLGRGGSKSGSPGSNEIHNGADDNASGTAVLIEIARKLASREEKLSRRIVFIAFTGEERGLLGSAEYVRAPLFPMEKTVAMLNMDMVGRLKDDKLIVNGTGTAEEFSGWIDEVNERLGFRLTKSPGGYGPSDHQTFYVKKIPVLHFFTGSHSDYHRPTDDFENINVPGMRRVGELVSEVAVRIAQSPDRPQYREVKPKLAAHGPKGVRPYFGSIPDFSQVDGGYALSGVAPESPAARAGMQGGDVIVRLGDNKIGNLEDFDGALRKYQGGDKVPVVVRRGIEELTLEVTLDPPR